MKNQWRKGKLIGRGTFGSVYVASNRYMSFVGIFCCCHLLLATNYVFSPFLLPQRENGALCAMKEVELFHDDPKSAECIKQLEQVI